MGVVVGAQVVAQGDNAHAAGDATLIAHQCALLRGVIPVLATATCSTGPMATDGSLTDWALRTVRLSSCSPRLSCLRFAPCCHTHQVSKTVKTPHVLQLAAA